MAQSQTGDVEFNRSGAEAAANRAMFDGAVSFRFVVTLKCLSIPLDPSQAATEAPPMAAPSERPRPTAVPAALTASAISVVVSPPARPPAPVVPEPPRSVALPDVSPADEAPTDSTPAVDIAAAPAGLPWDLTAPEFHLKAVVPSVLRAFKKPATDPAPEVPPASSDPAPAGNAEHFVGPAEPGTMTAGQRLDRSLFPSLYTAPPPIRKSLIWKIGAAILGAIVVLISIWRLMNRPAAPPDLHVQSTQHSTTNDAQTTIERADWIRQSAVGGDPGVKQTRQLVLYKPGLHATNSRIEFAWSTDSGDVGMVFRAKDLGNYYAVRLKLLNPRTTPTLDVEYFSVYQFAESAHTDKFLMLSKVDPALRVRLDIFGPTFTLYLQDNATQYWTDARLTSGALGFFEEWNRSPQVNAVRISLIQQSELFHQPLGQVFKLFTRNQPSDLPRKQFKISGGV
jgi:hypothetical protein